MKKISLFTGRNLMSASMLGILVVAGANGALAAEESAAVQAAGVAVDEKGAQMIALADAGVAEEKAERLYTKAERENGENVYEVSFHVDTVEYEYLILEADGTILEWELDGRDLGDVVAEQSLQLGSAEAGGSETELSAEANPLIGIEKAKEVAFTDAGVETVDIKINKLKYENDGRAEVYEIEFSQNRQEYEYTIDAYTGEVRKMERD